MGAIEFVKRYGIDHAKYVLSASVVVPITHGDLKQIVEAFELVEKAGGLDESKSILGNVNPWSRGYNIISNTYFGGDIFSDEQEFYISDLLKAIELVEKCNASD